MNSVRIKNLPIGEGRPKICVPIVGKTLLEMRDAAVHISQLAMKPDLVEIRIDWFENVFQWHKVIELLETIGTTLQDMPLLFTFRTAKEGGEQAITMEQYRNLLLAIAESGLVDAVDVEAFSFEESVVELVEELRSKGMVVIGSNHDFHKTPAKEELIRRLYQMRDIGMDIAKIAVMPANTEDVLALLGATVVAGEDDEMCPVITMAMSGKGVISRLAGEVFHSAVTFACVGKASAPGQIPLEQLEQVLEIIHRSI